MARRMTYSQRRAIRQLKTYGQVLQSNMWTSHDAPAIVLIALERRGLCRLDYQDDLECVVATLADKGRQWRNEVVKPS